MKTTRKSKKTAAVVSAVKSQPAPTTTAKSQPEIPAPLKSEPVKAEAPKPNRVCAENRISIELVKPEAKQVYVAGSFNEWKPDQTPLSPAGNGRWVGNLQVKPGRHEYLFVVDGQWLPDPNAKESVQNPFGGRNSVLVVSE